MKIIRTLEITQNEFYDYLENDLIENINQSSNSQFRVQDIKKGAKYKKFTKDDYARVDITITEYIRGELYKSKIKTFDDTLSISYQTKETPTGLQVTFNQRIDSFENSHHNILMKMFSEAVYYGRMCDTLYDIEKRIVNIREGIVETPKNNRPSYPLLQKLVRKISS